MLFIPIPTSNHKIKLVLNFICHLLTRVFSQTWKWNSVRASYLLYSLLLNIAFDRIARNELLNVCFHILVFILATSKIYYSLGSSSLRTTSCPMNVWHQKRTVITSMSCRCLHWVDSPVHQKKYIYITTALKTLMYFETKSLYLGLCIYFYILGNHRNFESPSQMWGPLQPVINVYFGKLFVGTLTLMFFQTLMPLPTSIT